MIGDSEVRTVDHRGFYSYTDKTLALFLEHGGNYYGLRIQFDQGKVFLTNKVEATARVCGRAVFMKQKEDNINLFSL